MEMPWAMNGHVRHAGCRTRLIGVLISRNFAIRGLGFLGVTPARAAFRPSGHYSYAVRGCRA
jgi:hypothetical protein